MGALSRLTAYLCSTPGTEDMDEHNAMYASMILDDHAHELAEQIREHFRAEFSRMTAHMGTAPARHRIMGAGKAADLIDPEVKE